MAVVRWQDWNGNGLEHCCCHENAEGLVLEGVVAGTRHGAYGGHYLVRDIKRLDALQNLGLGPADLFVAFLDIPIDGIGQGRCLLTFRSSFELIKGTGSCKTFFAIFDPCRSS
ncbi:hypothetical protein ROLI_013560 [Roseobacter fucihabitans]|uniref:Uncharacterized protein n=1 Tax=Roseobacter fucihabitans TaxID=1537242 RepID=A0ABZ2BR01_9RHOB|nr:hypothetical protein [Roseobacter litoralis]